MKSKTAESNGSRESEAKAEQPDFKWAVEWLVKQEGQRRAAEILGVNRKTVTLALRRERLTGRMNHAVQTLLGSLEGPVKQEVMPLDRIETQIRFLLESMDELDRLIERLTLRVEALEGAQAQAEAENDDEAMAHVDGVLEDEEREEEPAEEPEPEREQAGRRVGWWER